MEVSFFASRHVPFVGYGFVDRTTNGATIAREPSTRKPMIYQQITGASALHNIRKRRKQVQHRSMFPLHTNREHHERKSASTHGCAKVSFIGPFNRNTAASEPRKGAQGRVANSFVGPVATPPGSQAGDASVSSSARCEIPV